MAEKVILEVEVKSAKASKDLKKVGDGSKKAAKETTLLSIAMGSVKKAMLMRGVLSVVSFIIFVFFRKCVQLAAFWHSRNVYKWKLFEKF